MVVVEHGKQLFPRAGFIRGDLRQILHKFALFLLEDSQNERLFIGVIAVEGHFGDASMFSNPLDAGRLISFAIKQRAGVAENVRLFWLHAFSCRMVRCHDCR